MHPEACEHISTLDAHISRHEDALEYFGNISEIEGVVELGGSRKKAFRDLSVKIDSRGNSYIATLLHSIDETVVLEKFFDDGFEDHLHGILTRVRNAEHMEMAHEPRSQRRPASTRWRSSAEKDELLDLLGEELGSVVETSCVDKLSKQFYGWLCAELFDCWHVAVIHVYHTGLVTLCA